MSYSCLKDIRNKGNEKSHLVLKKLLRILNIKSHRNYSKFVLIRKKKGRHVLIWFMYQWVQLNKTCNVPPEFFRIIHLSSSIWLLTFKSIVFASIFKSIFV